MDIYFDGKIVGSTDIEGKCSLRYNQNIKTDQIKIEVMNSNLYGYVFLNGFAHNYVVWGDRFNLKWFYPFEIPNSDYDADYKLIFDFSDLQEDQFSPKTSTIVSTAKLKNAAIINTTNIGISKEIALMATQKIRSEIYKRKIFNLVERDKMEEILKEQGFQLSGCTSTECAVEIGKLLNVHLIIGSSLGKIGNIYSLEIRLIDVGTGKVLILVSEESEVKLEDFYKNNIEQAVNNLNIKFRM